MPTDSSARWLMPTVRTCLSFPPLRALAAVIGMAVASAIGGTLPAIGADHSARDVTKRLFEATREQPADYADANLSMLDLSRIDFKASRFTGADFYGTDLTGSSLVGTELADTRLDRAVIIGANFSEANLEGASLLRPTTHSNDLADPSETARFANAKMAGIRIIARLPGADFRGADLTDADFSPLQTRRDTIATIPHCELAGADFAAAKLRQAKLFRAELRFASFRQADLSGADLREADLTRADFTGAILTGADLTGAIIEGADFTGAIGLSEAKGVEIAAGRSERPGP
ncbi:MAG: pentapeptide repeat-containing protein [Hyphomicrobiaceae bacterium]|nr:pentapeptide repeat-containing protein [Hyphomicrobiaceae bacterium]